MMWLLRSLSDPLFARQGGTIVFFPYGQAWVGYEVSAELRERLQYLVAPYVGYETYFLVTQVFFPNILDPRSALLLGYPAAAVVLLLYVVDVSLVTRGLPRAAADLGTSRSAFVRVAKFVPILLWTVLCVVGGFMAAATVMALVIDIGLSRHDWLSAFHGVGFFGLGEVFFIGQLRLARRARRPAPC